MNWVAFRHRPQSGEKQTTTVFPMSLFSQVQQLGTFDWPEGAGITVFTQNENTICILSLSQLYQHLYQHNYNYHSHNYINDYIHTTISITDNELLFASFSQQQLLAMY